MSYNTQLFPVRTKTCQKSFKPGNILKPHICTRLEIVFFSDASVSFLGITMLVLNP